MIFLELLKSQGLSDDQVKSIAQEMVRNRIFITNEEKIEERYQKMKLQRDHLRRKLKLAEKTLEEFNRSLQTYKDLAIEKSTGNELQSMIKRE